MQTGTRADEVQAPVRMDRLMQTVAEHKGCGTSGGGGKASCGSGAGQGDMPPEIWEKVKNHPCYSEEAHHHYRAHACGGGAGLQHPVQLLQPQVRLRQREPPGRGRASS